MGERVNRSGRSMDRRMGRAVLYPWSEWDDKAQWAIYQYDPGHDLLDDNGDVARHTAFSEENLNPRRERFPEGDTGDRLYAQAIARRDAHLRGDYGWPTDRRPGGIDSEAMVGNLHSYRRRREAEGIPTLLVTSTERKPGWPDRIFFQFQHPGEDERRPGEPVELETDWTTVNDED